MSLLGLLNWEMLFENTLAGGFLFKKPSVGGGKHILEFYHPQNFCC